MGTSTSNLTPNTENNKEREGRCPSPIWSVEGSGAELCSASHRAGCGPGALTTPPQAQPQATPSVSFPHKQGLGHDRRWCSPAPGEGLRPFSEGVRRAWGPENTFMWQRQGARAFSVTPRLSPKMAAVGSSLSAGPEFRAHLTGRH